MKQKKTKISKKPFSSVKGKIYFFFSLFLIITLTLVWIFSVILLQNFYRSVKTTEVKTLLKETTLEISSNSLETNGNLKSYNLSTNLKDKSVDLEINIAIYVIDENEKVSVVSQSIAKENLDFIININSIIENWRNYQNGGSSTFSIDENQINDGPNRQMFFNDSEKITYGSFVTFASGENGLILLTTNLIPVDAVSKTIAIETIIITGLCIILMIVLSNIMSNIIAKPLHELTINAKQLSNGNYDASFNAKGYSEVEDLSNTLDYAQTELMKTESLQRDLIANVSHELRTPLTLISGYSEMMKDIPEERTDENINIILNESIRLSNLVNDVLELSKLQANVLKLNFTTVNISLICKEVVSKFENYSNEHNFNITFYGSDEVYVKADEDKIFEVVYNFVANAINYSKDTNDVKDIRIVETIIDNTVKISVFDEGIGIKSEDLENIWLRYYKVYDKQKQKSIGSGLGLSIVKEILNSHEAKFGVNSKYGEGSEFYFILDIVENEVINYEK